MTTEFHSDVLSYQTMRSTCTQSQLCTTTPILSFVQCPHFVSAIAFVSCHICFKLNLVQAIMLLAEKLIHVVFTNERSLEGAIEVWPEWDLNPRPWNSFQMPNWLSYWALSLTCTQSQVCSTLISSFVKC